MISPTTRRFRIRRAGDRCFYLDNDLVDNMLYPETCLDSNWSSVEVRPGGPAVLIISGATRRLRQ